MFRFESLDIWKMATEYASDIYKMTEKFPKSELYGLISQLRRAAVSISNNIAEGSGSSSNKDFRNFLDISIKSTFETVNMIMFAEKMKLLNEETKTKYYDKAEILIKKISSFKNSLK